MKKIIISSLVIILTLSIHQLLAQRPPSGKIDHLKTELELSDDQVAQLEKIFEAKHEEMMALKNDESKTRDEKHEAMKSFREKTKKEIESILTEEQLAKFQEIKKEHHGHRGKKMGFHGKFKDGKGKELHEKIKAYKEENIKPVMLEQRAKLEPKISEADKQVIAEFRTEFEKMKAERKAKFKEMEKDRKNGKGKDWKKMHKNRNEKVGEEKFEKMKNLVEKYKDEIEPLFAEVADQQEKWKKDIEEITKTTLQIEDEEFEEGMKKRKEHHKERKETMKMGRFLLLDPNEELNNAEAKSLIQNVSVYPNPASSVATLEYEVFEDGNITIELHNQKGKLLKTIKRDEFQQKGKNSVTIPLEQYRTDLFYIIIKDKNGITTTQNLVRVR